MTWPLVLVRVLDDLYVHDISDGVQESGPWYEDAAGKRLMFFQLPIGACWFEPKTYTGRLSPKYFTRHTMHRAPLTVLLPGRHTFCVDGLAYNQNGYHGDGWDVTGDPPMITVTPSINLVGLYHGWITSGAITDDCEGRTFMPASP